MDARRKENGCDRAEHLYPYVLQVLPDNKVAAFEVHLASCPHCARDLDALRRNLGGGADGCSDVPSPPSSLTQRLAHRIAEETGDHVIVPPSPQWSEPEWEHVAPGISCKLLASDADRHRVSMLVRLAPGAAYPPHSHAGVEELYLLSGELWIDERKLYPGDYNRAEPETSDERVWSETGCTCVLITSTQDALR